MVQEGLGLDVAGGGEVRTALKAGVDPARIVLHGNAKGIDELALAVRHGIGLVVVDGPDDVERLEELVPSGSNQDVLVRVIPGVTADVHAHVMTGHEGSKFGLAPPAAAELIARIERSDRITMRGLHVHIGSQILDTAPFARSVAPLAALGAFDIYDLGGGLGARYSYADEPPAVAEYLDALIGAAREHLPGSAQVIIEPGRSMVASAAVTLYRVTTVKRGAHTFVAVDGGRRQPRGCAVRTALRGRHREPAGRVRPDRRHRLEPRRTGRGGRAALRERGRPIDGVDLVAPRVGDLLVVPATGAYCFTMANNYNGSRRIPVVFADDGAARLVVRRETWEELLRTRRRVSAVTGAPPSRQVLSQLPDRGTQVRLDTVGLLQAVPRAAPERTAGSPDARRWRSTPSAPPRTRRPQAGWPRRPTS